MQEERELLMKHVFPNLQDSFRERDLDIVPIDLRWGVTEEEKAEGGVISICLGEIER